MANTPTGILNDVFTNVENLLANLSAFQTFTGEADAADAATHIYWHEAIASAARPIALLRRISGRYPRGESMEFIPGADSHDIGVSFIETTSGDDTSDAIIGHDNSIGPIIEDILSSSPADGYARVQNITLEHEARREEHGDYPDGSNTKTDDIRSDWIVDVAL